MIKHKFLKIYKHPWQFIISFLVILLPFAFLWLVVPSTGFDKADYLLDLLYSSYRLFIAFFISAFLALLLGLPLSQGKVGETFLPLFDVLQSFPTFAALPMALRYIGANDTTVIFFLIITMVWPILFSVISSIRLTKVEWEEAAYIYGARGWKKYIYFALPISYPALISGSIVGLGEGWEALVGGEIIVQIKDHGLGGFFGNGATSSETLFGVFALLLFIFAMNKIIWLPLLYKSHKLLSE